MVLGGLFGVGAAGELLAGTTDSEALIVQQAADLADHQHVLALIVATVATALDRLELGELLLPVAQHVGLYVTQVADFTDGEITLSWNRRQFVVMTWFQHRPQPVVLIFVLDGR